MTRLLTLLLSCVLTACVWFVGARFVFPAPDDAHWIQALYTAKEQALQRVQGPKVILVAGSSSHYSFSATQLGRRIGLPVVNYGTHAGLGARYILDRAAQTMKPGDTVILAIENGLIREERPNDILTGFVQFYDPGYVARARPSDLVPLLTGVSLHELLRSSVAVSLLGSSKAMVNEVGDATDNLASKVTPDMKARVAAATPVGVSTDPKNPPLYLRNFVMAARARGVTVMATWSPMLDNPLFHDPADPRFLKSISSAYAVLGVPVLGTAQDFLFPLSDMFTTNYHLNDIGRSEATAKLGDLICGRMKCLTQAGAPAP